MATKTKFSMQNVAAGNKQARKACPKVADLLREGPTHHEPSEEVTRKLGSHQLIAGIDLETNDFLEGKKPSCIGRFGHHCWCAPADLQYRIVQIGWVVGGSAKDDPITDRQEHLVTPCGYLISEKAAKKHGITDEIATRDGRPLADVLEQFMQAIWSLHKSGGVVVSHHLEFDAGIIDEELQRCGMDEWQSLWRTVAMQGVCTLDLSIQDWFQTACGRMKGPGEKTLVLNLKDSVMLFYSKSPLARDLLLEAHTAGADAELHLLLYQALRRLACEVKPGQP